MFDLSTVLAGVPSLSPTWCVVVVNPEDYHDSEQEGRVFIKYRLKTTLDSHAVKDIAEMGGVIRIEEDKEPLNSMLVIEIPYC